MPATFWLIWHGMRDRSLLKRTTSELEACRTPNANETIAFDSGRLCNQHLLQSSYAETLRKYVAVYTIRKPEFEDAQVLDYTIPKNKMVVISSAMAHMDKRNWNLGDSEEHPVEEFWADRLLTYGNANTRPSSNRTTSGSDTAFDSSAQPTSSPTIGRANTQGPRFSLNGYNGAWIPFGGGIHQCPGRHWVKLQMLLSFAMISDAFEIELLDAQKDLKVDMAKYGLGALQPAEKARFKIRRKTTI